MTEDIKAREKAKYAKMWKWPRYRLNSPGYNAAPAAWNALKMTPGESLRDYGCGQGKAMDWFAKRGGLVASGVDIVSLRKDITEICLWELPGVLQPTDFAFCADVMEHIPPEYVAAVIKGIRALTKRGGFFSIATIAEWHGAEVVGEPLHLTVESQDWWREMFLYNWGPKIRLQPGDREWRFSLIAEC